ncbi:ABC transporter permease [Azospirillum sp. ST 5-10]|uniref:ABC transporter permease n=1 Tax=unclassified Azospirillum TaxID=2630922 RepID=UPI003F4A3DE6
MAAVERTARPPAVRRRARLAMVARLVLKALAARGGQVPTALGSIAVGAAVVSALLCLYLDVSIKMSEELRAFGANFTVAAAPSGDDGEGAPAGLDGATWRGVVEAVPADVLVGASPFLYGVVRLDLGNAVLAGVDFAGLRRIAPYWQVEGGWVSVSFDERNAMVGRRLAESMELKPGDTVTIVSGDRTRRAEVTVKGVVDTGDTEDGQIFVTLSLAQRLLDAPDRADLAMLSIVARGAEADALAAGLERRFPGIAARPIRKISQSDGQILERIEGLMALVAATILVVTTLCVNATLTAMVARRTPELGLQKALGASDRAVVAQVLLETAAIALAGVALGLAAGFALAQLLGLAVFDAWVTFRPVVAPLTLAVSLAAALAAAVVPIRSAVRVVPARVLRGE